MQSPKCECSSESVIGYLYSLRGRTAIVTENGKARRVTHVL